MRGRGEGSIYRRADGYWVGSVEAGLYPNGKRRKVRVVRKTRVTVTHALDELRRQVDDGAVPDRTSTLASFLDYWVDEVAQVSPSSLAEYRKRVRRVPPEIGRVKLHKLTTAHLQRLGNQLGERLAPKTVRTTIETIRSALRWAHHAGMIARNPAEGVRLRSVPEAKTDDTLTPDEVTAVLAVDTPLHALVWLALKYGLRLGELLDLQWCDVDLPGRELTVRKGKTAAAARTLPLIDEAVEVLRQHRRQQPAIGGYVFPSASGGRRSPQRTRDAWHAILEAAGVERRRFHASRHTAATVLLSEGVPLEVVSSILGHANIGITADVYARVRADLKRAGLEQGIGGGR